ncbi:MAG TPA: amidohydrolase family protein [Xanthomonadales bacterium]|nr:amidohydrolase family protein [Xanthomonadales bacterium]
MTAASIRARPNVRKGLQPRLRSAARCTALLACALALPVAGAQELVIRNARVHTVAAQGTLERADVLVRDGRIVSVGSGLAAGADATVVDAAGRALTPGLFGGITAIGLEEVSLEPATVDSAHAPGVQTPAQPIQMRPEFDPTLAFNPRSALVPVARIDGMTWTMLAPHALPGGTLVAGQGAAASLSGAFDAILPGTRTLFVAAGAGALGLAGGSRAAEWMLLEQAIREARADAKLRDTDARMLTLAGREALATYLDGGRVAFGVDRAADIRQVVAFAKRHGIAPVIVGGAEAWVVAGELARAKVPVVLDPLVNLPGSFDALGATSENAARLHAAGVTIAFTQAGDASHNARKLRQVAGNAVAWGLPWDAALAAISANPAAIFGAPSRGAIAAGQVADLVLWSGDPLEVTTVAEQVWIEGRAIPMRSRQTELRDRYLPERPALPRAYGARTR